MRLGIDFGTTNSAVAVFDRTRLQTVQVDTDSETPDLLPSLIRLVTPATVYVAFTATATQLPDWLRPFARTDFVIETWDDWFGLKRYSVYARHFREGLVTLGGPRAQGYGGKVNLNYLVIVQEDPEISMQA